MFVCLFVFFFFFLIFVLGSSLPQVAPFPTTQSSKKQAAPLLTPVGNRWSSFAWCKKFLISQTLLIFGLLFQVQWFNTALTKVKLLAEPTMVRSSLSNLSSTVWAKTSNGVNNKKIKNKKQKKSSFGFSILLVKFRCSNLVGISSVALVKLNFIKRIFSNSYIWPTLLLDFFCRM